jgi:para-aminobenzoate synthetase component 1
VQVGIEAMNWEASPRQVYARLGARTGTALLESAKPMPGLARWSYVAGPAAAVLETRDGVTRLSTPAAELERWSDPFIALRAVLQRLPRPTGMRPSGLDFAAGLVGHLGYDLVRAIERLPEQAREDPVLPALRLLVADHVLACDHETGRWYCCTLPLPWLDAAQRRAVWADTRARAADAAGQPAAGAFQAGPLASRTDPDIYLQNVERCLAYIHGGDVLQTNLSHRLEGPFAGDPFAAYCAILERNPAPFAAYLEAEDFAIASASPERFLKLRDGVVTARPIKGTRPRGLTPEEDRAQYAALAGSEKDRAENLMIVDLMRNDLGRVARIGTVRVDETFAIEDHPSVWQMVSTVRAELASSADAAALLRACWPPGSMTGAPKVRAMQIIEELEPVRRGPYAGSIGYFDCGGTVDLSVVIRTAVMARGRLQLQAGGGIVADSDPQEELQETYAKARLLRQALENA